MSILVKHLFTVTLYTDSLALEISSGLSSSLRFPGVPSRRFTGGRFLGGSSSSVLVSELPPGSPPPLLAARSFTLRERYAFHCRAALRSASTSLSTSSLPLSPFLVCALYASCSASVALYCPVRRSSSSVVASFATPSALAPEHREHMATSRMTVVSNASVTVIFGMCSGC